MADSVEELERDIGIIRAQSYGFDTKYVGMLGVAERAIAALKEAQMQIAELQGIIEDEERVQGLRRE